MYDNNFFSFCLFFIDILFIFFIGCPQQHRRGVPCSPRIRSLGQLGKPHIKYPRHGRGVPILQELEVQDSQENPNYIKDPGQSLLFYTTTSIPAIIFLRSLLSSVLVVLVGQHGVLRDSFFFFFFYVVVFRASLPCCHKILVAKTCQKERVSQSYSSSRYIFRDFDKSYIQRYCAVQVSFKGLELDHIRVKFHASSF